MQIKLPGETPWNVMAVLALSSFVIGDMWSMRFIVIYLACWFINEWIKHNKAQIENVRQQALREANKLRK